MYVQEYECVLAKKIYHTVAFHVLSIDWTGVNAISCNKNQSNQSLSCIRIISICITITENGWRVLFWVEHQFSDETQNVAFPAITLLHPKSYVKTSNTTWHRFWVTSVCTLSSNPSQNCVLSTYRRISWVIVMLLTNTGTFFLGCSVTSNGFIASSHGSPLEYLPCGLLPCSFVTPAAAP